MMRTPLAVLVLVCGVVAGCDTKPEPVRLSTFKSLEEVGVNTADPAEVQAVLACETARVGYLYRLRLLAEYYTRVGNSDRLEWTQRETQNAREAQWFKWTGIPPVAEPAGPGPAGSDDRMLVESLAAARNAYIRSLASLYAMYEPKDPFKAKVIRRVQQRLDVVRVYGYSFETEIPGPDLKPVRPDADADRLFDQALGMYRSGKGLPLLPAYQKERQALMMFQEIIKKHPDSTRIALSAFYIGEIYKEFFNENVRAVRWFERAWQWDPTIPLPARFEAATVYDLRLGDREKAIELYTAVQRDETFNASNVNTAQRRLRELLPKQDRTPDRPAPAPPQPLPAPAVEAPPAVPTAPVVIPVAPAGATVDK